MKAEYPITHCFRSSLHGLHNSGFRQRCMEASDSLPPMRLASSLPGKSADQGTNIFAVRTTRSTGVEHAAMAQTYRRGTGFPMPRVPARRRGRGHSSMIKGAGARRALVDDSSVCRVFSHSGNSLRELYSRKLFPPVPTGVAHLPADLYFALHRLCQIAQSSGNPRRIPADGLPVLGRFPAAFAQENRRLAPE